MDLQGAGEHEPVGFGDGGACGGDGDGAQGEESFAEAEEHVGVLDFLQGGLEDTDTDDAGDGDDAAVGEDVDP